jgi:hypothetical protein
MIDARFSGRTAYRVVDRLAELGLTPTNERTAPGAKERMDEEVKVLAARARHNERTERLAAADITDRAKSAARIEENVRNLPSRKADERAIWTEELAAASRERVAAYEWHQRALSLKDEPLIHEELALLAKRWGISREDVQQRFTQHFNRLA